MFIILKCYYSWKQFITFNEDLLGISYVSGHSGCCRDKRRLLLGRKSMTKLDSILESKGFANSPYSQSYGFSSSHVQMWELDHKESWAPKNWSFWDVVLEKTLDSPLGCKEIKPVHPKGNQFWIFIGRTDAKALIFWSPDVRNQLIGKDPDAGKDWRQEEKGVAKDVMVR